jgi:hypothetical protein
MRLPGKLAHHQGAGAYARDAITVSPIHSFVINRRRGV